MPLCCLASKRDTAAGTTIQIYCALIALVLLVLWTGRKPSLLQWEALQLCWMVWIGLGKLSGVLPPKENSPDPEVDA